MIIKQCKWTELRIPGSVILKVAHLAAQDKEHRGVCFQYHQNELDWDDDDEDESSPSLIGDDAIEPDAAVPIPWYPCWDARSVSRANIPIPAVNTPKVFEEEYACVAIANANTAPILHVILDDGDNIHNIMSNIISTMSTITINVVRGAQGGRRWHEPNAH